MPTEHCYCYLTHTIDEHPDPGACFDWMRTNWDLADLCQEDCLSSLKGFCDYFNLDLKDYSICATGDRGEFVKIAVPSELEEISSIRLWKYLQNNYAMAACNGEPLLSGNCPFTGMVYDESALDPIREFMKMPDKRTWQELADDCIHSLIKALHADGEYRYSDEALREDCESNGYEFKEDGSIG